MKIRQPAEKPLESQTSEVAPASATRRPYSPPQLRCWGDVRDITLGGSAGQFDSANPSFTEP